MADGRLYGSWVNVLSEKFTFTSQMIYWGPLYANFGAILAQRKIRIAGQSTSTYAENSGNLVSTTRCRDSKILLVGAQQFCWGGF